MTVLSCSSTSASWLKGLQLQFSKAATATVPKFNIAPENDDWNLEDYFPFGKGAMLNFWILKHKRQAWGSLSLGRPEPPRANGDALLRMAWCARGDRQNMLMASLPLQQLQLLPQLAMRLGHVPYKTAKVSTQTLYKKRGSAESSIMCST